MSIYPELDLLSLTELINRFEAEPYKGEEILYFMGLTALIQQQGQAGVDYLFSRIDDADTDRLEAVLFGLTYKGHSEWIIPLMGNDLIRARDMYLGFLRDRRSMIVKEAILSLTNLEDETVLTNIVKLKKHRSPYVRGVVLHYVAKVHPDIAYPMLLEGLNDKHFVVREWAADELGESYNEDALPYLRALLNDPHPDVREAANTAIRFIEGTY